MRLFWGILVLLFLGCKAEKKEEKSETEPSKTEVVMDSTVAKEHPPSFPYEPYQKVMGYAFNQFSTTSGKLFDMPIVKEDGSLATTVQLPGVTLNQSQIDTLFSILNGPVSGSDAKAGCYDPRHAIVFYNEKDSAYAYFEVCFDCSNYEFFPKAKFDLRSDNLNRMAEFMKEIGLSVKDEY